MAEALGRVEAALWAWEGSPPPDNVSDLVIFAGRIERIITAVIEGQTRQQNHAQALRLLTLNLGHTARTLSAVYGLNAPPTAVKVTEGGAGWQARMESAMSQAVTSGGASVGRVALTAAIGAASLATPAKIGALSAPSDAGVRGGTSVEAPLDVVVGPGDTLVKLSERYYGTASRAMEIARMNGISNPNMLVAGTKLTLPDGAAGNAPVAATTAGQPSRVVVQPGDTLRRISGRVYGDEGLFMEIAKANGIADPNRIVAGATLMIPALGDRTSFRVATGGGASTTPSGTTAPAPSAAAAPAASGFMWPVRGVRSPGGEFAAARPDRPSTSHTGLDLAAPTGAPVAAAAAGRVTHAGAEGTYGYTVVIDHGNGYVTRYAHLSAWQVTVGQRVNQGQRIGSVGSTGYSTGPHLHFEVILNGRFVSPVSVLP
jgi:murein DD-endopeptidase MepM/ murein hydrolase activator NlpD